jgi:hypothetical protein
MSVNLSGLIALQCDAAVSHVQTVLLFLDDGNGEADHIPSSVSDANRDCRLV